MDDYRQRLLERLADYGRRYPLEADTVERFCDFVAAQPDCFRRELELGHVTGSAWLVDRGGRRVLLTHHRKLDLWVQLGGHADGNGDVFAVALAEAQEESGIQQLEPVGRDVFDIDIHAIPARKKEPAHYHYDVRFAFRATDSERFTVSDESHDLAWIEIAKLGDLTQEASMTRMARKWLTLTSP